MKRPSQLGSVLACTLSLFACGGQGSTGADAPKVAISEAERGTVLAKVGDVVITQKDFENRLAEQAPFARARFTSAQRKQEFLDSLLRFEVLAKEAEAKGYDQDPEVQLARKQAMVRKLMAEEVPKLVKLSDITDAEIAAYYQEHLAEFDKPAEVRAAHLLVKDEATAKKLLAELLAKIGDKKQEARDIFAEFVRHHSEDAGTREAGGDLQFFGKPGESRVERAPMLPEVAPPVALAAWGLEGVGDIAPEPVRSSAGFHLVQKTGFKRAYKRELTDVQQTIRNKLFRVKKTTALEKYVADIKAKVKIEIDERVLAEAKAPAGGGGPGLAPPTALPGMGMPGLPGVPGAIDPEVDAPEANPESPESKP